MQRLSERRECHDCGKVLKPHEVGSCRECDKVALIIITGVAIAVPAISLLSWWLVNG